MIIICIFSYEWIQLLSKSCKKIFCKVFIENSSLFLVQTFCALCKKRKIITSLPIACHLSISVLIKVCLLRVHALLHNDFFLTSQLVGEYTKKYLLALFMGKRLRFSENLPWKKKHDFLNKLFCVKTFHFSMY